MSKARDLANAGTALTTVSATELGYLDGVTSAVQTQIDSKIGQATAINPTIVDAKGDIIAATAADTVSKLTVGANDTVLTADSSTATGLKWAAAAVSSLANTQTFTSSTTFTVPSGVKTIIAYLLGGGGGGGSGAAVDNNVSSSGASGGNGGAFGYEVITVTPGESITVTVGAGGAGGAGLSKAPGTGAQNGNNGSTGGTTSFKNTSVLGGTGGGGGFISAGSTPGALVSSPNCVIVRNGAVTTEINTANSNGQAGIDGIAVFPNVTATTGTAGTTAPNGTNKGTGGGTGTAGFAGSGGGGGGGTITTARAGGTGTSGSGGGGGAASTNGAGTTTAGAGGAGAANSGAGGGGGGTCLTANATITSGAGGNGGSGAITIFY